MVFLVGLILLAAYSVGDLRDKDLTVISVYGSKDGVQEGDGSPDITGEEQIMETVEFCVEQISK